MESLTQELQRQGVDPELVSAFARQFGDRSVADSHWRYWAECVDDSDYGWEEWVQAVSLLDRRVQEEGDGKRPDFPRLLGYVHCTAEGARSGGFVEPLPGIVNEAFDAYGFAEED